MALLGVGIVELHQGARALGANGDILHLRFFEIGDGPSPNCLRQRLMLSTNEPALFWAKNVTTRSALLSAGPISKAAARGGF
jgi:hypothetical protein